MTTSSSKRAGDAVKNQLRAAAAPKQKAAGPEQRASKFTLLLAPDDAAAFDELALTVRRATGRRVVKSDLVRALVRLALHDEELREGIARELAGPGVGTP